MPQAVLPVDRARALATDGCQRYGRQWYDNGDRPIAFVAAGAQLLFAVVFLLCAHLVGRGALAPTLGAAVVLLLVTRGFVGAIRAGATGAAAFGLLAAIPLAMIVTSFDSTDDLRLGATLFALGVVPLVAATIPAMTFRRLNEARREDVMPVLALSAVCGGLGVLVAMASAGAVGVSDGRLAALVPYVAAAMALLGMAEVLAIHRIGAGFAETVAAIAGAAVVVDALLLVGQHAGAADAAVATTVAGGVAAAGLMISTALATPRPFVVPIEEAAGEPRLVPLSLGVLVLIAALVRVVSMHRLWIDEADTARLTGSSFADMTHAAAKGHATPPLFAALAWLSRQLFGSGVVALRLPSLVAGVLLVPAVYLAAEKLFDRRVGLIAAALVAVGPGFVWLSGEAGPGALAALLVVVSLFALLLALRSDRPSDWVFFGAGAALLLWCDQLAIVPVVIMHLGAVTTLWQRDKVDRTNDGDTVAGAARTSFARWGVAASIDAGAFIALLIYRGGFGPAAVLPPFEYATRAAPGAGRSVFGLTGAALAGLVGFHPADVTSRLLALWPLCMLAAFVLLGRSWSRRGALLVALALGPLAMLLALQIAGSPRNPPFALAWMATAMPMLAIGVAGAVVRARSWPTARLVGAALAAVLLIAAIDQRVRVEPLRQYDVSSAVDYVGRQAHAGDLVVYAPDDIGDLVREKARGATVVPASEAAAQLGNAPHIYAVGAFAWRKDDPAAQKLLDVVHQLSTERQLTNETGTDEAKTWTFN